jgi:hypothetical protein
MTSIPDLEDLAGTELSGVCFVRDYVEFHFDGPRSPQPGLPDRAPRRSSIRVSPRRLV